MIGRHLMIDGLVPSSANRLNDASVGASLLEDIVHRIDMTMMLPPITIKFPHAVAEATRIIQMLEKEGLADSGTCSYIKGMLSERQLQTYGYTTVVVIAESHLTLHTFPEESFFTFDCYSCKDFDAEAVIDEVLKAFPGTEMNLNNIVRRKPVRGYQITRSVH